MNKHTVHATPRHAHFKAILTALALLLVFFIAAHKSGSNGLYSAYDVPRDNLVIYTTSYYSVFPVDVRDASKGAYLCAWYHGQEYAALVDSDTPRGSCVTLVFDTQGNASDLRGYCLIDCIVK